MSNELPNIWVMQTENNVEGLINALKHPSPQIRKRAAAALRVVGAYRAAPALQEALVAENDVDVRTALTAAIDYLTPKQRQPQPADSKPTPEKKKQPQTRVERLIQHLTGPRPDLALQAANALAELKDPSAVPALIVIFRNRRQPVSVRLAAAEALLAMNSAPAEVTLLGALRSEKWHLRRNGAAILGRLQAEWAVQPLAKMLYDPNELVARTARAALRRIATPEARQALEDAKHAIIDTADAIDPRVQAKARRLEQEKIGNLATGKLDPDVVSKVVEKRKKDTSDLNFPAKKPSTGSLKRAIPSESNRTTPSPQATKSDAASTTSQEDDERTKSRKRRSSTTRLSSSTKPDKQ